MNVFDHVTFHGYLLGKIQENKAVYRYRTRLAEVAGCQPSFLSQVLGKKATLTLDHGLRLAKFWELSRVETDAVLCLLQAEKASSEQTRNYFEARFQDLQRQSETVVGRIAQKGAVSVSVQKSENRNHFYSDWRPATLLLALTLPGARSAKELSVHLNWPEAEVEKGLQKLELWQFAKRRGDVWSAVSRDLHLNREAFIYSFNHLVWRQKSNRELARSTDHGAFFTGQYSLSRKDAIQLRKLILDLIQESRDLALKSESEQLVAFNVDYFPLTL